MIKIGFGVLVAIFTVGGFYINGLQNENRDLLIKQGELQSELNNVIAKNKSLAKTIEQQQDEITQAQTAADEIESSQTNRREIVVKEVVKIEKELVHEECANVLVPGSDERLYYN